MESMSWGELEDDFQEDFNEASRPYDEDRLERGNFRKPRRPSLMRAPVPVGGVNSPRKMRGSLRNA